MDQLFSGVSWLGVIVGAILAFLAGWAWYSAMLFGKGWAKDLGIELGNASNMPMMAMGAQALGLFGLSLLADRLAAMPLVFALAVLSVIVYNYSINLFGKRGMNANWTDAGYLAAVGVILLVVNTLL
jgi:hypothetical protein